MALYSLLDIILAYVQMERVEVLLIALPLLVPNSIIPLIATVTANFQSPIEPAPIHPRISIVRRNYARSNSKTEHTISAGMEVKYADRTSVGYETDWAGECTGKKIDSQTKSLSPAYRN